MVSSSHHVTAVITHRVRSGREQGYRAWIKGIAADVRQFDGHLGVNILQPQPDEIPPDYVIVMQFDTCEHLDCWLNSETRQAWGERAKPLIQDQETIQVLTGLEAWFQLPRHTAPSTFKRHKQAVLVWVGVMVIALFVTPLVTPILASLPFLLQTSVSVAITVALLTYVVMPQLTRWFRWWLFS